MYESVNQDVLRLVPAGARRVLDLGCGTGALGAALGARAARHVTGVTCDPEEAARARERLDAVLVADLEAKTRLDLPSDGRRFDLVILSHVLEHLRDPERVLRGAGALLEEGGTVLVAVPNILFWRQRLELGLGRFRYTEGGILDWTHLRFFDVRSARALVPAAGFRLTRFEGCGHLPGSRLLGRSLGARLDRAALGRWPGLLAWQFVMCGSSGASAPGR